MKLSLDILKNHSNDVESNILLGKTYLCLKPKLEVNMGIEEVRQYLYLYERYMNVEELMSDELIEYNENVLISYIKEEVGFDVIPEKYREKVMLLSLREVNSDYVALYDLLYKYVKIFK